MTDVGRWSGQNIETKFVQLYLEDFSLSGGGLQLVRP